MYKRILFVVMLSVIVFMGCNDSENLKIVYDIKSKKNMYEDTISLIKTEEDFLANQINSSIQLFTEKQEGAFNRPISDEIMKLQNNLILTQTRRIKEQDKYIKELEEVIFQMVDPKREIITGK